MFPVAKSICAYYLTSIQICQNNQFKPPNYLYKISFTKNWANQINSVPLLEVVRNTRREWLSILQRLPQSWLLMPNEIFKIRSWELLNTHTCQACGCRCSKMDLTEKGWWTNRGRTWETDQRTRNKMAVLYDQKQMFWGRKAIQAIICGEHLVDRNCQN